jgi:hypothetical protein
LVRKRHIRFFSELTFPVFGLQHTKQSQTNDGAQHNSGAEQNGVARTSPRKDAVQDSEVGGECAENKGSSGGKQVALVTTPRVRATDGR